MPAAETASKGGRSEMSSTSDAILIETIKKEMRFHQLYENYILTPKVMKNLVVTNKPTSPLIKEDVSLDEITRQVSRVKSDNLSSQHWKTEGSAYGEYTIPLIRLTDPRFYHPKTVTEITKKYGTSLKKKDKEEKKA